MKKRFKLFGMEIERRDDVVFPYSHVILCVVYCAVMLAMYVALINAEGCAPGVGTEVMLSRFCGWGKLVFMLMATIGMYFILYALKHDLYRKNSGE